MRRIGAAACLLLGLACRGDAGTDDPTATRLTPLVAPAAAPTTAQPGAPTPAVAQPASGAEILDERDGRTLLGVAVPPPPDADATLRYRVTTRADGDPVTQPDVLALVDNALLLPAGRWLAVLPSTELVVLSADGQRVIDTQVARSLDLTPDGRDVVYMRGELPMFEIHEANLLTGETLALTDGFAPAWLPAFSEDATRVMFTSARSGVPAIYSVARDGGDLRQHTNADVAIVQGQPSRELTPSPTGPRAPLWGGGVFVFESDRGVVALYEDGRAAWTRDGAAAPRWDVRGQSVWLATRGAPDQTVRVSLVAGEPLEAP